MCKSNAKTKNYLFSRVKSFFIIFFQFHIDYRVSLFYTMIDKIERID